MRALDRNKQFYYYALYKSKSMATDTDNKYTGEYIVTYENVAEARDNISASRGTAQDDVFGVELDYSRSIATTIDRGIDEYTAIWIFGRRISAIDGLAHLKGDLGLYQGKIYRCLESYNGNFIASKWEEAPQTHKVVGVAKSLNSIMIALREVDYA